jgi:hypothetical protein
MEANVGPIILVAALVIFYIVVVGIALVQAVRDKTISGAAKVVWSLAIVVAPPFGSMAWYLFGHRTRDIERSVGLNGLT